jgi:hypothetical protein
VFASEGPEALKTIVDFMKDKAQPATIRMMAAKEVLDRGFGRPPQMVRLGRDRLLRSHQADR